MKKPTPPAEENAPKAIVAYRRGDGALIVAYLGDCGDVQSAKLQVWNWTDKIVGELGYGLVFAGLVRPDVVAAIEGALEGYAEAQSLRVVRTAEWLG